MRNMFKTTHDILLYKERAEFQEFGRAKKEYRQCRVCGSVYYQKSWHHLAALKLAHIREGDTLWMTRCPACKMIADRAFEGELIIEDIPKRFESELYHLIKAYTKRAFEKDCQHRLISLIKESTHRWIVTVTENQLANKLAQKIRDAFDKVDVKVAYSKEPNDVERVTASFRPFLSLINV